MASIHRQKSALRAAVYSFLAGAHCVTEEVGKGHGMASPPSPEMLELDFKRVTTSRQAIEAFADVLDEEELYPFGCVWPRDELAQLAERLIAPKFSFSDSGDTDLKFRFRKGFKKLLQEFASDLESSAQTRSSLDHWMALLLNTAFHAGATICAQYAETPKLYYDAIQSIEEETEAWTRYPQIGEILDRQLRKETRRKTGLVSDLDY